MTTQYRCGALTVIVRPGRRMTHDLAWRMVNIEWRHRNAEVIA
jgi:hypothetical protein